MCPIPIPTEVVPKLCTHNPVSTGVISWDGKTYPLATAANPEVSGSHYKIM